MKRRYFLGLLGILGVGGLSTFGFKKLQQSKYWPNDNQFFNPCLDSKLPPTLEKHEVILSALEGIDTTQMWDGHVHLIGLGDTDSEIFVNSNYQNVFDIKKYIQFRFYLNASCLQPGISVDEAFVNRLKTLKLGRGSRLILLAFDYSYDEQGQRLLDQTAFHTPNSYAAEIHKQSPQHFEWLASIHPYRKDSIEALKQAVFDGALGVKWLPQAMNINPDSPLCDPFYEAMAHWDIPLLCHCGDESAVHAANIQAQAYGNPLLVRRALNHGVKVVIAHCASLGKNNFELFTQLMEEPRYEGLLFGDISAMSLVNRDDMPALKTVISRKEWHSRLLYGSDYPLPGIIPLISLKYLQEQQFITAEQANVLAQLRQHNPLLFNFVLNRHLKVENQQFSPIVFHTRSFWTLGTRL